MRTSNPILKEKIFQSTNKNFATESEVMTMDGTVNKTFLLLVGVLISAGFSWYQAMSNPAMMFPLMMVGIFGGLIAAIVTSFKPSISNYSAPIYALLEGLFLGTISMFFNAIYPGIVMQAIILTMGIFFTMLFAYKTGYIKATEKFKSGIIMATGGIFFIYMISWIMSMFGTSIPYIHEGGLIGIGFSLFVIVIAALNLILDFDFIEKGAKNGAPKYMEWYAAFGLLVTVVWLYIEVLKLLAKLNSRD